jgi:amino acid adenylation domain-containing protein
MSGSALADILPLTPLQEGMLFHHLYTKDQPDVYAAQLVVQLAGELDLAALKAAVQAMLMRHANLRVAFRYEGLSRPVQVIPRTVEAPWQEFDLEQLTADEQRAETEQLIAADRARRFDLASPPLMRFTLIRLGPRRFQLVMSNHHIVLDGWSMPIFLRELVALYESHGDPRALPRVRPYRDYLGWLAAQDRGAAEDAWRAALAGLTGPTLVAPDTSRVTVSPERYRCSLSEPATAATSAYARSRGLTVNTIVQAAWAIVVSRLTGRDDVVFGVAVSGRPAGLDGVEDMVGLFINTQPLRVRLHAAEPLADLLTRVQTEQTRLLDHHHLGLTAIQQLAGHGELFDTFAAFENYPSGPGTAADDAGSDDDLHVVEMSGRDAAHYPLALIAAPGPRLSLRIDYRPDVYDEATVTAIGDRLTAVFETLIAAPGTPVSAVGALTDDERDRVLRRFNDTGRSTPRLALAEMFERQAAGTPHSAALIGDDLTLSYAELDARANRLAHHLLEHGVRTEDVVALMLPRSPELFVAILAVAKVGAVFLSVDTGYPAERIRFMLGDAAPALVLTKSGVSLDPADVTVPVLVVDGPAVAAAVAASPATSPGITVALRQAAYIIYTSGSTGVPKGVVVENTGLSNLAACEKDRFDLDGNSRWLQHASPSFDAIVLDVLAAFGSGAALVLAPAGPVVGEGLAEVVARFDVTHSFVTPSTLASVPADALGSLRTLVVAGEVLPPAVARQWSTGRRLINFYGPTEATVGTTMTEPLVDGDVSIGGPLANYRLFVLDDTLSPVPVGVPGELYVAGVGVGRGYWRRPGLTGERFVACPFGAGERMYRTGDLVRWRGDGRLDFVGRADGQVKLRGFRIELGEIESVLSGHPGISTAAVVVREDAAGDQQVQAYLVPAGVAPEARELRSYLGERLPDYMVPAGFTLLAELPLTANGKLDHAALPAPELLGDRACGLPRDPVDEILCRLFADTLGVAAVGIHDDFFELGGHSLLATRLVGRVRSALRVELAIRDLFEAPTVARLRRLVGHAGAARTAPGRTVPRPARLPLSFSQRRLWFLHQFEGRSATYNIPVALRLSRSPDPEVLRAALADVVTRHESLRTVFAEDGDGPRQIVLDPAAARPRLVVTTTDPASPTGGLAEAARHSFDLSTEPPIRAWLFQAGADDQVLLLLIHHIAGDAWSMPLLTRDLLEAYEARAAGAAPAWPALPVQYADFTLWQREVLGDENDPESPISRQLAYWRTALRDLPEQLPLPTDRPRPAVASLRGDVTDIEVPAALHGRLAALAVDTQSTLSMVLRAAVAALLHRLGAGTDIPLGSPIAGRTDEALDELVGFFLNTLVLRTDLSGDPTFRELIGRVRQTDLAAYAHQDVPFERLVEVLNPTRSMARHPLFQVMFTLNNTGQHTAAEEADDGDPGVSLYRVGNATAKFDLFFAFRENRDPDGAPAGLSGVLEFATDLFTRATAQAIGAALLQLLEAVAADPVSRIGGIDVLSPAERRRLLTELNDTTAAVPSGSLPEQFERQVARTPGTPAVSGADGVVTYAELNARANRLARLLIARGAGPEARVALAMGRGADLVVAMMAVLKAGAAYVPVDPENPPERIRFMLADAAPALVLTTAALAAVLPAGTTRQLAVDDSATAAALAGLAATDVTDRDRTAPLSPLHPAYVMYTSGSTGRPKAVVMPAGAMTNLIAWHAGALPSAPGTVTAQFTAVSFDVSAQEILSALLHGKTLVPCPEPVRRDPAAMAAWMRRSGIGELFAPNVVIDAVAAEADARGLGLPALTDIAQAGEPLTLGEPLRRLFATRDGRRLHNHYGPTETHVATAYRLPDRTADWPAVPPIGRPIANMRAYVLDARMRPVPTGVTGELYLVGAGLARGYHARPALTGERFLACPYGEGSDRMYRTGDLARWNRDGDLEYHGRADQQVKLRGFRIEPAEIESVLSAHEGVARCAVVLRGDRLVAYVVPAGAAAPSVESLRARVRDRVPSYMVPAAFVLLDELPLTPNGKLDRRSLPAEQAPEPASQRSPASPVEERLCELFAEVLRLPVVGADDDFFALGGHSFVATGLINRVREIFGAELTVRSLFEAPTPALLAAEVAGNRSRDSLEGLLPLRARGSRPPLFCVHPGAGVSWCYAGLLGHLDPTVPVYGLQARGLSGTEPLPRSVEEMADGYLERILEVQPEGPYHLLGWSFGGLVAHAVATRLQRRGAEVARLILIDAFPPRRDRGHGDHARVEALARDLETKLIADNLQDAGIKFEMKDLEGDQAPVISRYLQFLHDTDAPLARLADRSILAMKDVWVNNNRLMGTFVPDRFKGGALLVTATQVPEENVRWADARAWEPFVDGPIRTHAIDCAHEELLTVAKCIAEVAGVVGAEFEQFSTSEE